MTGIFLFSEYAKGHLIVNDFVNWYCTTFTDESEHHRFGADPRDQLPGACAWFAQTDWPRNTEPETAQLLWLLAQLCKVLWDN